MSYTIEQLAKVIGATRIGEASANIAWLLTDSRSLSFPEETLFFALESKRNSGVKYIPDLIERGVRNFVISRTAYNKEKASLPEQTALNYLVEQLEIIVQNLWLKHLRWRDMMQVLLKM